MARKRAGKIEAELGAEACQELVAALAAEPNLTLVRIREIARERGIEVSLMGAKTFRDGPFERHLAKLESAHQFAVQVASMQEAGVGNCVADASRALLAQQVFEVIARGDFDPEQGLSMADLSLIVKRLTDSDQKGRYLDAVIQEKDAKLREMEAKEAERKAKARELKARMTKEKLSTKGLTPETLEQIEEMIGLL
jgi:hypothetical protein